MRRFTRPVRGASLALICLSLAVLIVIISNTSTVKSQSGQENTTSISIGRYALNAPEPIQITKIYLGSSRVRLQDLTPTYQDWLRDIAVEVKNTSNRNIKYIELTLSFPAKNSEGGNLMPDQ